MPEMSALMVQEPSVLNDSAQFCLDEIFQTSKKKKPENKQKHDESKGKSDVKTGKVETMNDILSGVNSQIPSG